MFDGIFDDDYCMLFESTSEAGIWSVLAGWSFEGYGGDRLIKSQLGCNLLKVMY